MEPWQKSLRESLTGAEGLAERFAIDPAPLQGVIERYPMRITPHYLGLIEEVGDPIWRQCVPDPAELDENEMADDPLNEENLAPSPAIVHRYPDRVLLLASGSCAVYCRFCTRKRKVGCAAMNLSFGEVMAGIDYIAATPQIKDVILSGGDPLLLPDILLKEILERLRRIPHVEILRIGSRVPVTLPERITDSLCALLRLRVRPYYLHHMDLARGTGHFRTRIETGIALLEALRGSLSGMAIPHYVIDTPGGRGKIPIVPAYLEELGDSAVLRTPGGQRIDFPNAI
ncbi:MAG TPA: radical SAM protein [Deferrimonas sp.]